MTKSSLILISLVLLVACSQEKAKQSTSFPAKEKTTTENKLKAVSEKDIAIFCHDHFDFSQDLSAIFVLTDQDCINCNRSFSLFIQNYLKRKDIGFVIESAGAMVDISAFIKEQKRPNLVFDQDHLLTQYQLLAKTGAYLLKNNHLDTLAFIHAATLEQDFKYIADYLK